MKRLYLLTVLVLFPALAGAAELGQPLDLTLHWVGYSAIAVFFTAYFLAMAEETTELRKSKPMVLAASLIWTLIAAIYVADGMGELSKQAFRGSLVGYAELFLFIMVSMTYLNAMEDHGVFDTLRVWLLE